MIVRRSIETLLKPSQFQVIHLKILRGEDDATEDFSVLLRFVIVEEEVATEKDSVLSGQISLNFQFHCQEYHSSQDGQGKSQIRLSVHLQLLDQDHQLVSGRGFGHQHWK